LLLNIPFRWCFYYDQEGAYTHGKMMASIYIIAYAFVLLSLVTIALHWKSIDESKKIGIFIFVAMSLASVTFQMFFKKILIELFIEALTLLGFLFTIEDYSELMNASMGIYNRRAFMSDTSALFTQKVPFSVLCVKFVDFTYYTKTLGIQCTDKLNRNIAQYLNSLVPGNKAYHCGNGVFAIVFLETDANYLPPAVISINKKAKEGYMYHNISIRLTPEIMLVESGEEATGLEDLLVIVDAPYQAPNGEELIRPVKRHNLERKIALEKAISNGLEKNGFWVTYQPIWNREGNGFYCAEALCRLTDPELGIIPPDEFIPLAESNGRIIEIGAFVLDQTCKFFKRAKLGEKGFNFIEVNLSVVQCMHKGVAEELYQIVKNNGVDPSCICFEITESAAINSPEAMKETLLALKAYGFKFALDDYGTGYSNFSYIFHMPFDIIKIDKSMLWEIKDNPAAGIALESTIGMMKKMGFKALCEGAETLEQVNLLNNDGIDLIQGYFFAGALKEEELVSFLSGWSQSEKRKNFLSKK
jgi:EAL domain-containing protein (putative c-di-GMP-specific phosphodiesterase class I)/GGDEF domain-containing protein